MIRKCWFVLSLFFVFQNLLCAPLAVEFLGLNAKIEDHRVSLSWSTASENANMGFILEKRSDSLSTWELLDNYLLNESLLGQGTVSYQTDYNYIDSSVSVDSTYYYRLSGIDEANNIGRLDSLHITVFETSTTFYILDSFGLNAFPNPFNPTITIHCKIPVGTLCELSIFNLLGQRVYSINNEWLTADQFEFTWDAQNQPSGIYTVVLSGKDHIDMRKIVLVK